MLTVRENASIDDVTRACRDTAYTHIHVLAHGNVQPNKSEKYGICLRDGVIPGDQFATAITSLSAGGCTDPRSSPWPVATVVRWDR